ncbi:MAG TPA: hypothetical protein VHC86_09735 [Opitutaceae bacterium]|nr:hypothetical protein [Opitutaceae bacterium]
MDEEPSIAFGPLRIWVHGRQFPDAGDYWDGNWLRATAECIGEGSVVRIQGNFLHLGELCRWKKAVEEFQRTLEGKVELPTIEPNLAVEFDGRNPRTGHFDCKVSITGEHLSERHEFQFSSDQSYLPNLIACLGAILRAYPIREPVAGGLQ